MKIVQINETCGTGSIGRMILEMAQEYEKQGHICYVCYSNGTTDYSRSIYIGSRMDHNIHAMYSRITGLQGYASVLATKKLIKQLQQIQPDIVHLHNLHSNYINLRMLLNYLATDNIPVVITLHDCWLYTGKCTHYVPAQCEKWKHECGKCPLLHVDNINKTYFFDRTKKALRDKKAWFGKIERLAVVGVSKWVTGEASASIFRDRKPVTIYNWVDTTVFYPRNVQKLKQKLGFEKKKIILMVASTITVMKGYRNLVSLAENLADDWQIILIGKNAENLPIPENVYHLDRTNNSSELACYYSLADVCLNTTKCETFGMVTAEALCCGTPVIVNDNTASPELVTNDCGVVVKEEAGVQAIVEAIQVLLSKDPKVLSRNCCDYGKSRFKKEIGIGKYLDLYKSLLR